MGMCYSEVHRILNPKSSKGGVRKISEAKNYQYMKSFTEQHIP